VLSQDGERYAVDDRLAESLAADVERFPTVVEEARERYPDEPYERYPTSRTSRTVRSSA